MMEGKELFVVIKEKGYNSTGQFGHTITMYQRWAEFEGKEHFVIVSNEKVQKILRAGRKSKDGVTLYESRLEILERLDKAGINYKFALA